MLIYRNDLEKETGDSKKTALFLDRDGVINKEVNYLHRVDEFKFIDGIFDICRTAAVNDFLIIVITNQSGIARGYYSEKDLEKITRWMMNQFSEQGINISAVYACPHLPEADIEEYRCDCKSRKPNPGMILQAQKDYNIDLSRSIFIGDKICDMEAGLNAGINSLVLFKKNIEVPGFLREKVDLISELKQAKTVFNIK